MDSLSVVIIGGGGHARVVADLVRLSGHYRIIGYTDPNENSCLRSLGIAYLGDDGCLVDLFNKGISTAFMGIGGIKNSNRGSIYHRIKEFGYAFPKLFHPKSVVANDVYVGEGTLVMAGATINSGAYLEDNVIINTGAIVEHDCVLKEGVQISPGVVLCGGVKVQKDAFIGAGACIIPAVTIGERATVGAGAVVIDDVLPDTVVVGNPARIV